MASRCELYRLQHRIPQSIHGVFRVFLEQRDHTVSIVGLEIQPDIALDALTALMAPQDIKMFAHFRHHGQSPAFSQQDYRQLIASLPAHPSSLSADVSQWRLSKTKDSVAKWYQDHEEKQRFSEHQDADYAASYNLTCAEAYVLHQDALLLRKLKQRIPNDVHGMFSVDVAIRNDASGGHVMALVFDPNVSICQINQILSGTNDDTEQEVISSRHPITPLYIPRERILQLIEPSHAKQMGQTAHHRR